MNKNDIDKVAEATSAWYRDWLRSPSMPRCRRVVEVSAAAIEHMGMTEAVKVTYRAPDPVRVAHEEHNETQHQSDALRSNPDFRKTVHPAIVKAIHHFAKDRPAFLKAMATSKVEKVKGKVGNSEIGKGSRAIEDKEKVKRVRKMMASGPIDRPIIIRHKEHQHLLAGNTRATIIGHGVEAHHIEV